MVVLRLRRRSGLEAGGFGGGFLAGDVVGVAGAAHGYWDEHTQSYLQRRTTEGMSRREIIRCLKRYVALELYRYIQPLAPAMTAPAA
ncbi:hypothetical protein AB0I68_29765 [Streptomyces sp. NPDC050448]|uniref:hypothetical protein n=1 Tax=Streptomyces sp. NPDC050448 TaxID=3155404 RepID=UPI003419F4BA